MSYHSKLKDILWNTKLTHSERVQKIKELKKQTQGGNL